MSKRFGALMTVALLLGGAACSSGGATPLSKAEFTKQASAICAQVTKEIAKVNTQNLDKASPKEQADALEKLIGLSNKAIDDLKDLTPPKDQADDVAKAIDLQRQGTDKIATLTDDVRAGNKIPEARSKEIDAVSTKANAAWDKAGVKKCGSESSSG